MNPSKLMSVYSFMYKNIPLRRIIFVAFVALSMFLIFIKGTDVTMGGASAISALEFGIMMGIIGISIIHPKKYQVQVAVTIIIFSILIIILETLGGIISIETFVASLMLICGVGLALLK